MKYRVFRLSIRLVVTAIVIFTAFAEIFTISQESALLGFSGLELVFTIIYVIVFMTLSIASVFELFNLKASYFPAYVKYLADENSKDLN